MRKKKISFFDIVVYVILLTWGIVIFYPIYNCILASFMTAQEYMESSFSLWVKDFTFEAYEAVFAGGRVARGYLNTFIVIVFQVPLSLFLITSTAYVLSRKPFIGSKTVNNLIVLTMYFGCFAVSQKLVSCGALNC